MSNDALRVEWRPAALADLEAIFAYLLPLNPHAAERVVQELSPTVAAARGGG
jgi:plasmid stabilization system protein ParE